MSPGRARGDKGCPPAADLETSRALQSLQGAVVEDSGSPWPAGRGDCRPQAPSLCPLGPGAPLLCLEPKMLPQAKWKLRPPAQLPWAPPWPTFSKAVSAQAPGCHPPPPSQLPSPPFLLRLPHPVTPCKLTPSGKSFPCPLPSPLAPIGSVPSREVCSRQQSWENFFTIFK